MVGPAEATTGDKSDISTALFSVPTVHRHHSESVSYAATTGQGIAARTGQVYRPTARRNTYPLTQAIRQYHDHLRFGVVDVALEGRMLIAAARLFDGHADSIVEDPLIEVAAGRIVNVTQRAVSRAILM